MDFGEEVFHLAKGIVLMIKRYFEDYKEFTCVANNCPDTCCSGWLIEIDENSLERFEEVSKSDNDFKSRIDFKNHCFYQAENKDCSFLLDSGFCKMQKEHGESMLCYTCDMFPRHVEEFPDVREYSLSASCPEVAKAMVLKKEYLSFTTLTDDEEDPDSIEDYEDYNDLLYEKLLLLRERIIEVLKCDACFEDKAAIILDNMQSVQEDLDIGFYDGVENAFEENIKSPLDCRQEKYELDDYLSDFEVLFELEVLRAEFVCWAKQSVKNIENVQGAVESFAEFEKTYPQMDLVECNIAIYFIFTYFCGAVYDGYVYSAAKLAVFSARMIKLLCFAQWLESGKVEMDKILYKYCREVENSTENIRILVQSLDL